MRDDSELVTCPHIKVDTPPSANFEWMFSSSLGAFRLQSTKKKIPNTSKSTQQKPSKEALSEQAASRYPQQKPSKEALPEGADSRYPQQRPPKGAPGGSRLPPDP